MNVSDCVTFGDVSAPVTRSTSVAPYARGANAFLIASNNALEAEGVPPCASPHAIMIAPARKFSCLSIPSSRTREQSNPTGTSGSVDCMITCGLCWAWTENSPKPSSARKTPTRKTKRLIKEQRIGAEGNGFIAINSQLLTDARDYRRSKLTTGQPSSPQTSMSNSLVVREQT